ncbi:CbiQ family ECF transporter T component [Zoogloea sp.]|uniref:CbiQ family ECF transporter T component n=1 Tax=Zoogloea sp. TaxID=49181 RepID=UPI0035AF2D6D
MIGLHPATRLVAWAALVVLAQLARGPWLWGLGLIVLVVAVLFSRHRAWRLIKRVRVLLLVLCVLFALFTPGELVVPLLGSAGPTQEGLGAAFAHCVQLLVVVLLVAVLLETTREQDLVAGLMVLSRPLRGLGLPVDRLAVRVLLVFRYVERPPVGGWRALLVHEDVTPVAENLRIRMFPLRWWDGIVGFGVVVLILLGAVR